MFLGSVDTGVYCDPVIMRTGVSAMEGRTLQYKDVGTSEEN